MERKPDPLWKNAMNYGAIGGGIIFVFKLLLSLTGLLFSALSFLAGVIFIVIMVLSVKNPRDTLYNGTITYRKAFTAGFAVSVFMGIIIGFYVYLDYALIKPENMDTYLKNQEEMLTLSEPLMIKFNMLNEGELDDLLEEMYEEASPLNFAYNEIRASIFKGLFFALIIAAFLRKEEPVVYNNENTHQQ